MNTVIYARYSAGPRQTDQSIEGQLRVCTDFCKQRGLTVIDTYCDRHISGRTDERPEFQRLIADAKRKKFEAVVVYKTDRFARNKYDSAVYKRELKRNGIQIFYAAEAIPDGPEGIILESLMEGLAEYYSAELAQKIKRGMHESALKCQSTGSGRPLGYRVDEQKRFQIDPESAQTVQTIFEQYIKGESNAAICELLNSRGLRTAQGKPFNKNSINRIIKNRKYIGEYRYHDIVVEGGMPAIIPKDTFNLAQAEMERRRTRKAPKSPKAEYLLAGRLFCGHCKGPMQGVSGTGKSGNKWYYYYCGNTRGKNKTCDKKQVSRDRLERAVVDFTVRYILQEEVLEELARKVHAAQERQNDTASEIAFYEKKLADNKKSIANVLRAIESGAATQTLPARLQELENEQAVILGEISFLKGKRLAFTEDQILFALMKHLEPYPGESEQDYRRRIISDFVSEVYLYDDRLLIYFNISSEDGKLKSADLSNIEGGEFDEGLVSSGQRESNSKFGFFPIGTCPVIDFIQHLTKKLRVRGIERIAGLDRRCRSVPFEHHTVDLIIGDHAVSVRRRIALPVIRVTVVFGMDDAADVHGIYRLPPGLLLLQLDRDGDIGISKQGLRGDLRIGGAHVSQIHRLPAPFQLRGKHRDRDGDQHGNDRDDDQHLHQCKTFAI